VCVRLANRGAVRIRYALSHVLQRFSDGSLRPSTSERDRERTVTRPRLAPPPSHVRSIDEGFPTGTVRRPRCIWGWGWAGVPRRAPRWRHRKCFHGSAFGLHPLPDFGHAILSLWLTPDLVLPTNQPTNQTDAQGTVGRNGVDPVIHTSTGIDACGTARAPEV
jgi:hypothetical protein